MSLDIPIESQPNDSTCGPTCLQAVYRHFGINTEVIELSESIHTWDQGGTFGVCLGIDALQRGLRATLYSYNLAVFDPTWKDLDRNELQEKLREQLEYKPGGRLEVVSRFYQQFLQLGGDIRFSDLSHDLLKTYLDLPVPIITGLSATYLYQTAREFEMEGGKLRFDDVRGRPMGHFVVLTGMTEEGVQVADPYPENPEESLYYTVPTQRLLNAILLGNSTYDANLLVVSPDPIPDA